MNRRNIFGLSAIAALGLASLPGGAISQQRSLKEQIVGTWTFVSALDVKPDGTKSDRWGSNPQRHLHIRSQWPFRAIHHAVRHS